MAQAISEGKTMKRIGMYAAAIILLGGPVQASDVGPDAAGYKATDQATYGFENIASSGARILAGADDATAAVNLGFAFRFYGLDYTSVCISSNGLLAFGSCNLDFANADLSNGAPSGDARIAAPFWSDLNFGTIGSDAVFYQLLGTAPQRRFVVQWNSAFPLNATAGVTFQAILYEGTNNIAFQYLSVGAAGSGKLATVGIRDAGGQLTNRFIQWSYNAPVIRDGSALLFTPGGGTARTYAIEATVNPAGAGSVSGTGSYPAGTTATLTATANPGYVFASWSGSLGNSTANPLIFTVDGKESVTANFTRLMPVIAASVTAKTGPAAARVWTVQLTNTGAGAASDTQLTGITFGGVAGTPGCSPAASVVTPLPVDYGLLAAGNGAASNAITFDFSGCPTAARFSVTFEFRANGGAYTGATKLGTQTQ